MLSKIIECHSVSLGTRKEGGFVFSACLEGVLASSSLLKLVTTCCRVVPPLISDDFTECFDLQIYYNPNSRYILL